MKRAVYHHRQRDHVDVMSHLTKRGIELFLGRSQKKDFLRAVEWLLHRRRRLVELFAQGRGEKHLD